jgi:SAM-dependent methyltransferase
VYETDLAYIHDAGFTAFADRAAPEIIRLLHRHGIHDGLVVDVGCGSGPLAAHLIAADYEVVGIDASAAMIRLARARVPEATFRRGSLETAQFPRSAAVIALNEVVSYVPDPRGQLAALRRFFARVHAALPPGGLFVFDFIASADRRTYAGKSRSGPDWAVAARATLGRSGRVLTREITTFRKIGGEYRKSRETHRVQIYDPAAVETQLRTLGFAVTRRRSYGRLKLLPGDVAVIARKS